MTPGERVMAVVPMKNNSVDVDLQDFDENKYMVIELIKYMFLL